MIGEVRLFDPKFVHFMWDDSLKGKEVFASNDIYSLMAAVNNGYKKDGLVKEYGYSNSPFITVKGNRLYMFAYYDPNYEVKRAYAEGKTIQVKTYDHPMWLDVDSPAWDSGNGIEFRVKPDCPCEEGIDSKACAGCPQGEERKRERIEERASKFGEVCVHPEYDDEKCKKCNECIEGPDYRPYESSTEMIVDFIDRFKVNCPQYAEPLIWVKSKADDSRHLVTSFVPNFDDGSYVVLFEYTCGLDELFDNYTYLDGSHVGMEVKE